MSREAYGGRGGERWDTDRITYERDRVEETRGPRSTGRGYDSPRPRERSVDEIYERRVGNGRYYEDDRVRERTYYDEPEEPRYRPRRESVTIEKERERDVYSPPPLRRTAAAPRPGLMRRQSSLDTFDRRPLPRFYEREESGPLVRREDVRPAYAPPPIPRYQALAPPRRYVERDFEETKISEPDLRGDDYRPYPEMIREREFIRTRRRSRSRSVSSRSRSSSSVSASSEEVVIKKFPRRGKTRMPAKLVSIKAIIELGYPYEREGDVIIIQKALGPENIDEVIKLSETYKKAGKVPETSGGRSEAGEIVEERREEIIDIQGARVHAEITEKTYERRELSPPRSRYGRSLSAGPAPIIVDAKGPVDIIDRSRNVPSSSLVLIENRNTRSEQEIRAEIRALELERAALLMEPRGALELRRADQIRQARARGELVVYEEVKVKKPKEREPDEGVFVVKKNKNDRQSRAIRTMLKTLT